ncbi:hypothetical protein DDE01_02120 [Desulfovibrio desulfuricans]|nr:hypothetical protein DDE01_02120 [Desulfovibrio desulfuricans]
MDGRINGLREMAQCNDGQHPCADTGPQRLEAARCPYRPWQWQAPEGQSWSYAPKGHGAEMAWRALQGAPALFACTIDSWYRKGMFHARPIPTRSSLRVISAEERYWRSAL